MKDYGKDYSNQLLELGYVDIAPISASWRVMQKRFGEYMLDIYFKKSSLELHYCISRDSMYTKYGLSITELLNFIPKTEKKLTRHILFHLIGLSKKEIE